ncbi:MAG: hypothetical protein ACM3L5_00410 [Candidatus Saccharibacteria bacterium]
MSCYLRHLKDIFALANIEITADNRRRADQVIHSMVGVEQKDCPRAWAKVKERLAEDREGFITELSRRWNECDA